MGATQGGDALKRINENVPLLIARDDLMAAQPEPLAIPVPHGEGDDAAARFAAAVCNRPTPVVILPDQGLGGGCHQTLFDGGILAHGAVAVEMVGRQIGQDADARIEGGRQVNLEGRTFHHMDPMGRRYGQG